MKSANITSLDQFVRWSNAQYKSNDLILFRGQPVKGNLLPGIARANPAYDSTVLEKKLLNQFKLMGASMLNGIEDNSIELMVMAQHYGLKTRLLDWTSNSLAALFFACNDPKQGDTYVYALKSDDLITENLEKDPFGISKTIVFQPPLNNSRILSQQGWFTLHKYSDVNKKYVPIEKNLQTKLLLSEAKINASYRYEFMSSLARHGVSFYSLFPDLEGLSKLLNSKFKL